MAIGLSSKSCTVVLHDDVVSTEDALYGTNVLPAGGMAYLCAPHAKTLCIAAKTPAPNPDEVSVHVSVAKHFGLQNRMKASVIVIEDLEEATASHVELLFLDQHLSRADMWQMNSQIDGAVLYHGQKLKYLGSATANVEAIYLAGRQVDSALVLHPQTKMIFRSGSARYMILIQVSREMLEYWSYGDLLHERLVTGFLPALFERWCMLKVRHQVSLVLFGRRLDSTEACTDDFFHVLAMDFPSADWRDLLRKVKRAFSDGSLPRQVCLAADGNLLEAVHVASMDFADENVDPRLASTGTSIIAITAGAGLFDADHKLLKRTTELLMGNSIGVDIVTLSPKPLHPVPLFKYERDGNEEYALPHWVDMSYWEPEHDDYTSKWLLTDSVGQVNNVAIPPVDLLINAPSVAQAMDVFDEHAFSAQNLLQAESQHYGKAVTQKSSIGSISTLQGINTAKPDSTVQNGSTLRPVSGPTIDDSIKPTRSSEDFDSDKTMVSNMPLPQSAKREGLPPHALMQTGRKISLGPRGLAPSRGVASTTVSAQHAQQERETVSGPPSAPRETSSGIAKQIRDTLRKKPSEQSLKSHPPLELAQVSKPIKIKSANLDAAKIEEAQAGELNDPASLIEKAVLEPSVQSAMDSGGSLSATPKIKSDNLPMLDTSATEDDTSSITPWLTLLNPCNPRKDNMRVASEYRKWQNVFPTVVSPGIFKWDSICTPAALPLLTEMRTSVSQLERSFNKKVRRLIATGMDTTNKSEAQQVMLQLVAVRLTAGFQIVPMRKLVHAQMPSEHIERMLLSLGNRHHELRCLSDAEVQITEYERPLVEDSLEDEGHDYSEYRAMLSPLIAKKKERTATIELGSSASMPDWMFLDDQSVNPQALTDNPGTCRMRLVLIPVEPPRVDGQGLARARELSDEERRIDGIQRLTQVWQRHRYFTSESQRHQTSMTKPKVSSPVDRDPNPLAIEYQTRDPSAVVSAYMYGHSLTGQLANGEMTTRLFPESEMYHSGNFDIAKLVKHMQEPPPSGVEVRDRRWLTRLHLKCFRGDEMTNWLLRVFKDLQTREDAVALGNELMERGIFTHVRGKHIFRDGNYFYQIKAAHRTTEYPDTAGLFARGIGRSVPPTPTSELRQSPSLRPAQGDSDSSSKGTPTTTIGPADKKDKKELLLTQVLQYNVDPAKKSEQLEIVNLHYGKSIQVLIMIKPSHDPADRIHNPDNCYHIHLDWTSTTAKLIRESLTRWTSLVEHHGLKLVQMPLKEACKLHQHYPFDRTVSVKLAVRPPDKILATPLLDPHASSPRLGEDPNGYHKALLRKMDFVLDLEAAASFPRRVDVRYTWGRPDYELTQFVHKSGLMLAQISNDGKTDYLLLPNRLVSQAHSGSSKRTERTSLETVVRNFKAFCRNRDALTTLFAELNTPKASAPSPLANVSDADSDVPPIELPPHLLRQANK